MPFRLHAHGASDVGLIRSNNEDAFLCSVSDGLFLLADGLGGHQSGEIAAREAVEVFFTLFMEREDSLVSVEDVVDLFHFCYMSTNQYIYELSLSHDLLRGMGTTFCAVKIFQNIAVFSHVGDSRIYHLHDFVLKQLTLDHSIRRWFFGTDTSKGFLTRALGTMPFITPDIGRCIISEGDSILLCTDGLSDMLTCGEIEAILNKPLTLGEKVRTLNASAKQKGGEDNITMILIEVSQ